MKILPLFILSFATFFAQSQITNFWGTNTNGGHMDGGVIYKSNTNGTGLTAVFNFDGDPSPANPVGNMVQAPNGRFYGTTENGGDANKGTIYEYNPESGIMLKLYQFDIFGYGQYPLADLVVADNGKLYGTANVGGDNSLGVLFEYDYLSNIYQVLVDFDGTDFGAHPNSNLIQAIDGNIYGLTSTGGVNNHGVIFKLDPITGDFTKLYDLSQTLTGRQPRSGFCEASNGHLFTTTKFGGIYDEGTILEFDPISGQLTKEFDMVGAGTGANPDGGLTLGNDGILYGITDGIDGGSIIRYNYIDSIYTKILDLNTSLHGNDGIGNFLKHPNGLLYATCNAGGAFGAGSIIQFNTITGAVTKIHDFPFLSGNTVPCRNLSIGTNGKIYGTIHYLTSGPGNLFEYDLILGSYTDLYEFGTSLNGKAPSGTLIIGSDDKLYGVASQGGTFNYGCIYRYSPTDGLYEQLLDFDGINSGAQPTFGLVNGGNGKFYSTTYLGGANNLGVLYEYDPNTDTFTKLLDFNGLNGSEPYAELFLADNGVLYGSTSAGGAFDMGTIFKFDPTSNIFTKLHDFTGGAGGSVPVGTLMQANNGMIYGLTQDGGWAGTIFEFDPISEIFTTKLALHPVLDGGYPQAGLIQASNGMLYGTTNAGGQALGEMGSLFLYDIGTNDCIAQQYFGTGVSLFYSSLYEGADGYLYVPFNAGGFYGAGGIFKFDPIVGSGVMTQSAQFDGAGWISRSKFAEFTTCFAEYNLTETIGVCPNSDFTAPDGTLFTNISADFTHTSFLFTTAGCDSIIQSEVIVLINDTSVGQSFNTLVSNQTVGLYQWLDCNNSYAEIPGATFPIFVAGTTGSYAVKLNNPGCEDTSVCLTIIPQDFYNSPGYNGLQGEVFAFPVTSIDTCDAVAFAFASGGIAPYHYDWFTQTYNENSPNLDSLCEGFHVLKITDNIGDSVLLDYYVTDTANFYTWYDTTFIAFVDTVYISVPNCLINYSLPLDSLEILNSYYLMQDSIPPGELYFIEIAYYQSGNTYIHYDTISLNNYGWYLLNFTIYCPSKNSYNNIKTVLHGQQAFLGTPVNEIESAILVYPNPFQSTIAIKGLEFESPINIYSLDGKLVFSELAQASTELINLDYLVSGTYILKVNEEVIKILKY